MPSLIAKAKSRTRKCSKYPPRRVTFSREERDLALAWLADEITLTELGYAIGIENPMNSYVFIARALKAIYKDTK